MNVSQFLSKRLLPHKLNQLIRLKSCWCCGNNLNNLVSNLFCSNCNALQSPDEKQNYFKVMGVNETYDLDENDLAKKYKDLQKYLHPDKFANKYVGLHSFKLYNIVELETIKLYSQNV